MAPIGPADEKCGCSFRYLEKGGDWRRDRRGGDFLIDAGDPFAEAGLDRRDDRRAEFGEIVDQGRITFVDHRFDMADREVDLNRVVAQTGDVQVSDSTAAPEALCRGRVGDPRRDAISSADDRARARRDAGSQDQHVVAEPRSQPQPLSGTVC